MQWRIVKTKELTEESIILAIEEMNRTYDEKKNNAAQISAKIREENGVAEAVRLIESVM